MRGITAEQMMYDPDSVGSRQDDKYKLDKNQTVPSDVAWFTFLFCTCTCTFVNSDCISNASPDNEDKSVWCLSESLLSE